MRGSCFRLQRVTASHRRGRGAVSRRSLGGALLLSEELLAGGARGGEMISVASLVDGGEWRKVGMRSAGLDNRALARASTALRTFLGIDAL